MRVLDLIILILITISVAIGILIFAEVKKEPEIKYVTSTEIVEVVPTISVEKPATISGKVK
jgi:hypothetical protein